MNIQKRVRMLGWMVHRKENILYVYSQHIPYSIFQNTQII